MNDYLLQLNENGENGSENGTVHLISVVIDLLL